MNLDQHDAKRLNLGFKLRIYMNGLEIFFSLVEGPTHWLCKSTVPEDGTARRPLDSSSQHTRARNYEQVSASSPLAPPSKILVWHQMLRMLLRPQDEGMGAVQSFPLRLRFGRIMSPCKVSLLSSYMRFPHHYAQTCLSMHLLPNLQTAGYY